MNAGALRAAGTAGTYYVEGDNFEAALESFEFQFMLGCTAARVTWASPTCGCECCIFWMQCSML